MPRQVSSRKPGLPIWLRLRSSIDQTSQRLADFWKSLSQPGWKRRAAAATICTTTVLATVAFSIRSAVSPLQSAGWILLVSLFGFTIVALLTHDCKRGWKAVDYLWVCTSIATIVVALVNINSNSRKEEIDRARASARNAFSNVLYLTRGILEDDCQQRPTRTIYYKPSPEPYTGACDRMAHFLPQMEFEFTAIDQDPKAPHNDWGADIVIPDSHPQGRWNALYGAGRELDKRIADTAKMLEKPGPGDGPVGRFILSTNLRYWYFVLAFFLGLRISKITAEIL